MTRTELTKMLFALVILRQSHPKNGPNSSEKENPAQLLLSFYEALLPQKNHHSPFTQYSLILLYFGNARFGFSCQNMAASAPPSTTGSTKLDAIVQNASAQTPEKLSGLALYSRFALAGAVCCSVTHGGLTPVDVYVI